MAASMDEFAVLTALGARVVEVAGLGLHSVWVSTAQLLIIDASLDRDQRERLACRTLGRLAEATRR